MRAYFPFPLHHRSLSCWLAAVFLQSCRERACAFIETVYTTDLTRRRLVRKSLILRAISILRTHTIGVISSL